MRELFELIVLASHHQFEHVKAMVGNQLHDIKLSNDTETVKYVDWFLSRINFDDPSSLPVLVFIVKNADFFMGDNERLLLPQLDGVQALPTAG